MPVSNQSSVTMTQGLKICDSVVSGDRASGIAVYWKTKLLKPNFKYRKARALADCSCVETQ